MADDERPKGPDLSEGIDASSIPATGLLEGTVAGETVVLVRHGTGYCAWSGTCTHLEAPLADGLVVDGTLRCPWHHARFSLETGEAVAAPAFAPLTRYAVDERDGRLFVTGEGGAAPRTRPPKEPPARVVVVGGGAAGHACAELLARHGFGDRVTVVSDDADRPYDRTFCSKQYLIGMVPRDECFVSDEAFYRDSGPRLVHGDAKAIDADARVVVLGSGERVPFDVLVLATGGEPVRPEAPGFDAPDVHVVRTLRDTDALIAVATTGARAAIVGASFIGLEVAASLRQRDVAVDVVAPDEIPLARIVGDDVGTMIRTVHEEKGVRFHLGREAKTWKDGVLALDDGTTVEADFLVVGTGVKPRTGLAEDAGLAVASTDGGGGIVVDERLETSVPGVFAIGDVACYPDVHAGRPIRVEHWVHAQRQGQFVARHLMGAADRFDDLPFFWSAHFDTGLRYLGHVGKIAGEDVDGSIEGRDFTVRYTGDDGATAFTSCNRDLPALEAEIEMEDEALPRAGAT